ncbi:SGT1 protein-domain-containing protein, partial [Zopfochytrium polystomum]
EQGKLFLRGRTRFGDNVDDEWFIVFLLREITRKFNFLVATVTDNDGEFLLVESAAHLPSWLEPTTAANRVFIKGGLLHVIPVPQTPSELASYPPAFRSKSLSLSRAITIISRFSEKTFAEPNIQRAAFARCDVFDPANPQSHALHRARMTVPRDVARALFVNPKLIAAAVEAFYQRDPLQLKACQKMSRFPPSTSVTTTVKMTRTLYAQLASQTFHAPKPFRLPASNSDDFKAAELGMKLACGFEIIAADTFWNGLMDASRASDVDSYQFDADPLWRSFLKRLVAIGYFKDERPGSKLYKQLERTAKEEHLKLLNRKGNPARTGSMANNDQDDTKADAEFFFGAENPLRSLFQALVAAPDEEVNFICEEEEDSDGWMEIDPNDLEKELQLKIGDEGLRLEDLDDLADNDEQHFDAADANHEASDVPQKDDAAVLQRVVKQFESFVSTESTVEGVRFPHEQDLDVDSDDEAFGDDESDDGDSSFAANFMEEDINAPISIDPDKFMAAMMKLLCESYYLTTGLILSANSPDSGQVPKDSTNTPRHWVRADGPDSDDEDDDDIDMEFDEYMAAMDRELAGTKVGRGFERVQLGSKPDAEKGDGDFDGSNPLAELANDPELPVDVDMNLLKNLMESFSAQQGLPGPASNILGRMGILLPRDEAEE